MKARRVYIHAAGGNSGAAVTISRTVQNATSLDRMLHHFAALGYVITSAACTVQVADQLELVVDPSDPLSRITPGGSRITVHAGIGRCDRAEPLQPCTIDDVTSGRACATCAVNAIADVRGRLRDIRACSARCRGWRVIDFELAPCRACSLDVPVLRRITAAQLELLPEARAARDRVRGLRDAARERGSVA